MSQPRQQRSYAAQVLKEVFLQWGARLGMIWIGVLVIVAVFAPLLANSHPILLSEQGSVSSPLMHHLSAADVSLLIIFAAVLALYFVRIGFRAKFGATLLVAALAGSICYVLIDPPQLTEILLSKAPEALRRTKYYLDQGSDLPYSQTLAFEGVPREQPSFQGVKDFAATELRDERRKLLGGFWYD